MSTTDQPAATPPTAPARSTRVPFVAALVASGVAVTALYVVFLALDQPDTAHGVLVGGASAVTLLVAARWRSTRRAARAGTAARVGAGLGDERDRGILSGALAFVGLAAFLSIAGGLVAIAAGADPAAVLGVIEWLLLLVLVVSFVTLDRRG
ncbi:hypothetical protein GXP71_02470 [Cellulomonas sp. H30R-01]|uniref:hypothetical protein n=1 Tax=Cellulomonas sp. H30R-01 TaxID=2704467 RepID=UPI00138BB54E|nr:hypothetical protein [Cellulomonas sp. H30R-01]QHT55062.1 hypothetical protein GXP71_02470 [Cellulomonas sp. H30R-01]